MSGRTSAIIAGLVVSAAVVPARAQNRATADDKQSRYQIAVMERVLEGAVEHGATLTRDRLQAVLPPSQMLISDNARVRGFRLDGYGVFFDVEVPSLEGTFWSFRTLDQNDLGLQSAMKALKAHIDRAGDVDLQQALKRVELQVSPMGTLADLTAPTIPGARNATGSAALAPDAPAAGQAVQASQTGQAGPTGRAVQAASANDQILNDPLYAFREEIKQALMDAMLDHSGPLGVGPEEWVTLAARSNQERPRLAPADSDAQTVVMRARGADLTSFRAGQISREEAIKRIEVRVF